MADRSKIEWTDATWNPITGCSVVSPGCTNCYAMKLAGTRLKHHPSREALTIDTKAGPVWNGKVRLNRQWLHQPSDWKRPRKVFVCAHGDLFHEDIPDDWILDVFTVMAAYPHHVYQVLTKRSERMREFVSRRDLLDDIYTNWYTFSGGAREVQSWPLHNVWLGVSVEDQARAKERIPNLINTPAAVHYVSAEPLLGILDLRQWFRPLCDRCPPWEVPCRIGCEHVSRIDWVIAGGESGLGARPMHPDWVRSLCDQCQFARVPFFFKQWGHWSPDRPAGGPWSDFNPSVEPAMFPIGKKAAGRLLDGIEHNGMPEVRP